MSLNFAVLTATILPGFIIGSNSHARGVPSDKNGSQIWIEEMFSLQYYFTPFRSFKDFEIINEVSFIQF
jgi:hypothetical protein